MKKMRTAVTQFHLQAQSLKKKKNPNDLRRQEKKKKKIHTHKNTTVEFLRFLPVTELCESNYLLSRRSGDNSQIVYKYLKQEDVGR